MAQAPQNINPLSTYDTERKLLIYTGFFRENPEKVDIWYNLRAIVGWVGLVLLYISYAVNVCQQLHDFEKFVDASYLFLASSFYVAKMVMLVINRDHLTQIEDILTSDIFTHHTPQQDEFIKSKLLLINRGRKVFRFLCVGVVTAYLLSSFFNITKTPVPGWFPFNVTTHTYEVRAFQSIFLTISCFNHLAVDVMTGVLILLGSAQFKILKDNLMNVGASRTEDEVVKKLKTCAVHHQELLRYVNLIESVFSGGIFVQFLASSVILCVAVLQLTVLASDSIRYILFVFLLGFVTMELLIYCVCGHDIIVESGDILEACYFSEWYESAPTAKKMFIFLMERAKNPVVLTVGKLFPLSLQTLLKIVKSSFSFYAVLQSVKK